MVVVLVVALVGCLALIAVHLENKREQDAELPEELLARRMPSEYPAYKRCFEMQARMQASLPTIRS